MGPDTFHTEYDEKSSERWKMTEKGEKPNKDKSANTAWKPDKAQVYIVVNEAKRKKIGS